MSFLISILIVYGLTLILVQGKILYPIKVLYSKRLDKYKNYIDVSDEYIISLINKKHKSISINDLDVYNKILNNLNIEKNEENLLKLANLQIDLMKKIQNNILNKRKFNIFNSLVYWMLYKISEMLECMMCTGFWSGLFFTIITFIFNISICGYVLNMVTSEGDVAIVITMFLLSLMYAGTTWLLHCIIDFFYNLTEKLSLIDKIIHK